MKASFLKRFLAYLVDIVIVVTIIFLIYKIIPTSQKVKNLEVNVAVLNENYLNKQIGAFEYINDYSMLMYDIDKQTIIKIVINFIIAFIYFVTIPFITKGKTLGKLIMKIRIKSNKENLSVFQLFVRALITGGLGYLIANLILIFFVSKNIYAYILLILGLIQLILVIASIFMVIYRKDKKGIEDIIGNTIVEDKDDDEEVEE